MTLLLRHASQLESHAGGLAEDLARHRPDTPFGLQTVLVAHAGMARWLRADLAQRSEHGIAAGCVFEQPGGFLHRLGEQLLHEPGAAPAHRPEVLQLALFDLLGQPDLGAANTTVMQRFRNAGSIAHRLHRQGIYRSDWLQEYLRSRGGSQDARLWRALVERLGSGDRASHMQRLRERLNSDTDLALAPVFVFGLGHCPPDLLELLRLIARHTPVYWYFLNPCREYWLDFLKPRQLTEAELARRAAHADAGPPLLASLGEQGRELLAALLEADAHDAELDHVPNFPAGRLGLLQRAIFENQSSPRWRPDSNDTSLRVHACASPWAELEAVREALDAVAQVHGDLRPDEVLIMAVDPSQYRPWLDAVFTRDAPVWPLRVADLDWFEQEPWFQLLSLLLNDLGAPVRRSVWLSVLSHPEVQRHWRLDPETLARLDRALDRVHASFGIDGDDRGDGNNTHSLGAGVDRLWIRYAGESDETSWALTGLEAETLAHAEAVLAGLATWSRFSRGNHGLTAWCTSLRNTVIQLCGPGLSEFADARQQLWRMLAEVGRACPAVGDPNAPSARCFR
ncbi:MAG: exodeoxyribonuclease V subunit gamma [Ahniella sp.]|nr:exodeoxyribonuclease V subunit gamma [Ahniella sp.]